MIRTTTIFLILFVPLFLSSQIRITRVSKVTLDNKLTETSGLFMTGDTLWSHNDSGNEPYLFAIDRQGKILQNFLAPGMLNDDWEDATTSQNHIFIADIGNNRGRKDTLRIYRIPRGMLQNVKGKVEVISFSYSDSLRKANEYRRGNFNSEAIIYREGYLYWFSKNYHPGYTMMYRIPDIPGHYVVEPVDSFRLKGQITAADYNPATGMLIFCGYHHYTPFIATACFNQDGRINIKSRRTILRFKGRQTEAILIDPGNPLHIWMTAENSKCFRQKLIGFYLK